MTVRILGETSGPFRDYYFEDERYMLEMARIPGAYQMIDGVHEDWWSLRPGCRIRLRPELAVLQRSRLSHPADPQFCRAGRSSDPLSAEGVENRAAFATIKDNSQYS